MNMHYEQDNSLPAVMMKNRISENFVRAEISEIYWERVNLHFICRIQISDLDCSLNDLDFFAVTQYGRANAEFRICRTDSDNKTVDLALNVTNPGYLQCLPAAFYQIAVCRKDKVLTLMEIRPELAPLLPDRSREFLYSKKNRSYIVDFSIADNEKKLILEMRVLNTRKAAIPEYNQPPESPTSPSHGFFTKGRIKKMICSYYRHEAAKYNRTYSEKPRTVLFLTEQSEHLGSNLTSVLDRMKERGMNQDYQILTSARSAVEKHYGYKIWYTLIKKVAQADIIFVDDHCPFLDWLTLSPRTTLIQLWHAGAGFKSSGYSRWGHKGCPGPASGHRQYDYGITSSIRISHYYSEVFGINPEQILPTGMPRMDRYLDKEHRKKTENALYHKFPQCKDKTVILFAPTYRGKNRKDAGYPYEKIDFEGLYKSCPDSIILFKMHPWVSEPVPIPDTMRDRMFDVTSYPEINDLFYITDLLITDYSSNIFEFSLMKKPMLFYAFDEYQYAYSRGFHRPYEQSAPGTICRTFEELLTAIKEKDFDLQKTVDYVEKHFDADVIDTHASDRVIDWFLLGNIPEDCRNRLETIAEKNSRLLHMDFSEVSDLRDESN